MKFFRTEDAVSFHYGAILGLTEKQAKPRIQVKSLEVLGDGKFKVTGDVQFKIGELIGLEDKDIPKAYLPKLSEIPGAASPKTDIRESTDSSISIPSGDAKPAKVVKAKKKK